MSHPRTKICAHCGDDFHRPPSGMRDSDWARKVYCRTVCRYAANDARLRGTGQPNRLFASAEEANAELGSSTLLERMMVAYRRVANERGLANEWEAAVMLGMAA